MNELKGFGAGQPIRPTSAGNRPAAARPGAEDGSTGAGFGVDAAEVSPLQAPADEVAAPPAPRVEVAPEQPLNAWYDPDTRTINFRAEMPATEAYDGFMVSAGFVGNRPVEFGGTPSAAATGPIALIDDAPAATPPEFPGLSLNGPSTAGEGLVGLSGRRFA